MLRIAGLALFFGVAASTAPACNSLDETKCMDLRGQAYETLTGKAHPCGDDADCIASTWPGCPQPVSTKSQAKIDEIKKQFDEGKCGEHEKVAALDDVSKCREAPVVYCKQGLCVFKETAQPTQ